MRSKSLALVVTVGLNFVSLAAMALPSPIQVKAGKISPPMSQGVTVGGQAGSEFSLLAVRSEMTEGGRSERIVLSYGDRFGQPQRGEPGYFHVALDHDSKRVVIDLAQITRTAVDPRRLAHILKTSKLIGSSEMTMDPQDGSTNITLALREPVKIKVASVQTENARVVIELVPANSATPRN